MDERDKTRFCQLLLAIAELFEKDLSKSILNLYFTALKNLSIDQVEKALEEVAVLCKFFPKPVEIFEFVSGGPRKLEDRAQVEVDMIVQAIRMIGAYQSVQFTDPITNAVVQNCFGGWIKLCSELKENEEKWFRKDFVKYYQTYARQNIKSYDKLIGIHEAENTMKGFLEFIPKLVHIGEGQTLKEIEYRNPQR